MATIDKKLLEKRSKYPSVYKTERTHLKQAGYTLENDRAYEYVAHVERGDLSHPTWL